MKIFSFGKKIALLTAVAVTGAIALVSLAPSATVQASDCVAGTDRGDFKGEWITNDTVTLKTRSGGNLCQDTTVFVSSYKMPDNYNGGDFFGNTTAYPQYKNATKTVVLKKGTNGQTTVTIPVPDECTNFQVDAYLGPEITVVGADGHQRRTIKAKIVKATKDDCSVPKVQTCDTSTGAIVEVEKGKENTPPYSTNLDKCKKVVVCDTKTGTIVTITKDQANDSRYVDKDSDQCKVQACDTSTGTIVLVEKGKENTPPYTTNLDKCEKVKVCDTKTGEIVTVTKDEAKDSRYADQASEKCQKAETPAEVPSTGPAEIISGMAGAGSLAGAGSMYIKSRRALWK